MTVPVTAYGDPTANSLLLGGLVELIGATTNPEYRLASDLSSLFDFGMGEPKTTTVEQVYLDGDQVQSNSTGNRNVILPVRVWGSDPLDLSAKCDLLYQLVAQQSFPTVWSPDGGLPVVYDGLVGKASRQRTMLQDGQLVTGVVLEFPARPFGRSRDLQFIDLDAGSAAQLQLDDMDSGTFTNLTLDTSVKYEGAGSGRGTFTKSVSGLPVPLKTDTYASPLPVGRPFPGGAVDLTGYGSAGLRFRWSAPTGHWRVGLQLALRSSGVNVAVINVTRTFVADDTRWRRILFPLQEAWDLTAVDEWALLVNVHPLKHLASRPSTSSFWIDDPRAYPSASEQNTTTEGAVITVPNVLGSARAPANLELTRSGGMSGIAVHRPPTDQDPDAQILFQLGGTAVESVTADEVSSRYKEGTYAVLLLASTLGSGDRAVTVTATQTVDGVVVGSVSTEPRPYDSSAFDGKFLLAGELTLPPVKIPDDCTTSSIEFTVTGTASGGGSASQWLDLALLHNSGDTVVCGDLPTSTVAVYVDEPDPTTGIGAVYASLSDRSAAFSVLGIIETLTGGPMSLDPGDNALLVLTPEGRPDVLVPYYPHWLDERTA